MGRHNFDEITDRRGTECQKWDKYAVDILPMWIADTDFKCPQPIIDAIIKRAQHGIFGYPKTDTDFNKAIVNWQQKRFGWQIAVDMVEYTPAVIPAVIYAMRAFSCPGDNVLVQMPAYHPFHSIVPNNGRHILANNLLRNKDGVYEIDWEDLETKASLIRTKILILCHPHNPVGRVFSRIELERISDICYRHNVLVVSDEIHSDIVFAPHKHIPFGSLNEQAANNCIVCVNPSKTFNIAGMRSGAVIIPDKIIHEKFYAALEDGKGYGRTVFGTLPIEVAYSECDYYADELLEYLSDNLKYLKDYLAQYIPQIKLHNHQATYLVWLDCRELGLDDVRLNDFFLRDAKVAMNSGVSFGKGGEGYMRMNIACPRSTLCEGLERIAHAVNKL